MPDKLKYRPESAELNTSSGIPEPYKITNIQVIIIILQ